MRLVRYGPPALERPGLFDGEGRLRDLSVAITDLSPTEIAGGVLERVALLDPAALPVVEGSPRLGPPIAATSKIVCVGLNYRSHADESGFGTPEEPVLFMKAPSALSGPTDHILFPHAATAVDWEVELGVIIGRRAAYVSEADALDHVAGYCVANDISERDFQLRREGQWMKGKSADTFAPLGPWLVTANEVHDPQGLGLWLDVNGERMQSSSTAHMIFSVAELISYISRFMSLLPGDVIMTGTPEGVGGGMTPPRYLKPGDILTCGIEGLGTQQHLAVSLDDGPAPQSTSAAQHIGQEGRSE